MSSLTITVSADTDVVMSAAPGATDIGITAYQEPALLANVDYAPQSPYLHGQVALSWSWNQSLLSFSVCPFGAESESDVDTLIDGLRAAVSRMGYEVTVTRNGVSKVWRCDPGSVTPAVGRNPVDLKRPWVTQWNVSIPCHPVASSEES